MTQKPNSDKTGRAARRREGRQVEQAQRTVARAQARPQPLPGQEGPPGLQVSVNDLLLKIGALTVERDALQGQVAQRESIIARLTAPPETQEEQPAETDEGPSRGETVED